MATATHSTTKKTTTRKTAGSAQPDAVALLKADHRKVEDLFAQYEKARTAKRKTELVAKICLELKVHTQIEEEIFYPVSREFLKDEDIVDEAVVEHASAKQLIAELEAGKVGDDLYDAKVKVLSELIEHHVGEEEKEYFPQVKKTDMDLRQVGARMAERKQELTDQLSGATGH